MSLDDQHSFAATGPQGPDSRGTKIRISLKHRKEGSQTVVTQVAIEVTGGPTLKLPDPPSGEGDPPSPRPGMGPVNEPNPGISGLTSLFLPGNSKSCPAIHIVCSLEPPVISIHCPGKDADGKDIDNVENYEITHETQDVLVDWLRDPLWTWAPRPVPAPHRGPPVSDK